MKRLIGIAIVVLACSFLLTGCTKSILDELLEKINRGKEGPIKERLLSEVDAENELFLLLNRGAMPSLDSVIWSDLSGDYLLLTGVKNGKITAARYVLSTGKWETSRLKVDATMDGDYYEDHSLYVFSDGSFYYEKEALLVFFDASFQETARIERSSTEKTFAVNRYAVEFAKNADHITLYGSDGSEESYPVPAGFSTGESHADDGKTIYFTAIDEFGNDRAVSFDTETKRFLSSGPLPFSGFYADSTPLLSGMSAEYGEQLFDVTESFGKGYEHFFGETEYAFGKYGRYVLTTVYDDEDESTHLCTVRLYDVAYQEPIREFTLEAEDPDDVWLWEAVASDGYLIFSSDPYSPWQRVFALRLPETPEDLTPCASFERENAGAPNVSSLGRPDFYERKNNETADKVLYENTEFGVSFYSGESALRFENEEYTFVPETDEALLREAEEAVADFFRYLPERFLDEVILPFDGFDYAFVRDLLDPETGEESSTAAYTTVEGLRLVIVLGLADGYADPDTIAHEFMHAIEFSALMRDDTAFQSIGEFNPEGFKYYDSYVDENGDAVAEGEDNAYTFYDPASETDRNVIYFTHPYAKTYLSEDLAVTFESIYVPSDLSEYLLESENFRKKAVYLTEELRRCFSSVRNAETLPWEESLGLSEDRKAA